MILFSILLAEDFFYFGKLRSMNKKKLVDLVLDFYQTNWKLAKKIAPTIKPIKRTGLVLMISI